MPEKESGREPQKTNFEGNPRQFLDITGRSFEQVGGELALDVEAIAPGAKILVVGEGYSDFSTELQKRRPDISLMVVDRLYAIAKPTDTQAEVQEKMVAAGYDSTMTTLMVDQRPVRPATEGEKKPLYVAGDIYALPLADNSVEVIYLNHVYEHVDLGKALSELLRVLKDGGEIRFGGVPNNCSQKNDHISMPGEKGEMYLGYLRWDIYDGLMLGGPDVATQKKGYEFVAGKPDINLYACLAKKQNRFDQQIAHTLVFKKGTEVPVFLPHPDDRDTPPSPSTVVRVFPDRLQADPVTPYLETEVI